ncbi:pyocin knob domain-containing protein, partial [Streptococcus suis]|uniref:pyocin knob domain-containing protein n=1 Tax=Streptococcus suis TaxID=1307 RepID=UPI003D3653FE
GSNLANQPPTAVGAHNWKYVRITKHDNNWSVQEAIDFNGVASWFRVLANNTWKPWQRVALAQPSTWISTGVNGVHYKQEGAVVALRIKVSSTSFVSNYSLGTIPTSLLPVAGTDAVFRVVTNGGSDRIVRIKSTGICQIESYLSINESLTTTITWLI